MYRPKLAECISRITVETTMAIWVKLPAPPPPPLVVQALASSGTDDGWISPVIVALCIASPSHVLGFPSICQVRIAYSRNLRQLGVAFHSRTPRSANP
jgi:hypothetical protein